MPKLNPSRPIIERYLRVPIRELFWNSSGLPHQPTEQVRGGVSLKIWTLPNNNGMIEVGDRQWHVQYHPRSNWLNAYDEYCSDYWIVSANGRRHRYLLIGLDGSCATRSELSAHYQSEHIYSPQRILRKRRQILGELGLTSNPDNLDPYFVPLLEKPKGMYWRTWERHEQMRLGHEYVPVRRPTGMRTVRFMKLLRYLNKPHKDKGGGKDTVTEVDRIFGHHT